MTDDQWRCATRELWLAIAAALLYERYSVFASGRGARPMSIPDFFGPFAGQPTLPMVRAELEREYCR